MINVVDSGGQHGHRSARPSSTGSEGERAAASDDRSIGAGGAPPPSAFAAAVLAVVAATHPGDVLTYGEVASEAGRPGAARAVGSVLRARGAGSAWWRVVAANGRLVPGLEDEHARRLAAEGVTVVRGRVRVRDRR